MDPRTHARQCAVQVLYQMDLTGQGADEALALYWPGRPEEDLVRWAATRLVRGTQANRADIDGLIARTAENWRIDRMPAVDRNILRLAVYELRHEPDTPPVVVIDEAIGLARRFGGEESGQFVNGVLDALRKNLDETAPSGATRGVRGEKKP